MKNTRFVSTQNRLNLVFTLLFLVGVIILTSFIGTSISAMAHNAEARTTYTQARQLYQVSVYLQQFERALNDYELTSDYDSLSEYRSSYARLQQSLANIAAQTQLPGERQALDDLAQNVAALRERFDRVIAAVDEEDWESVVALDEEAYILIEPIIEQVDGLVQARSDALADLRNKVDTFSTLTWLATILALPIFLVAVIAVAWIVARQIQGPIIRMTDELKRIEEKRFDPTTLAPLTERRDEVGYLAREYLQMASAVLHRQADLQQKADDIRAKTR